MTHRHTCHAKCGRACPPRLLMCPECWRHVPKPLGDLVYAALRAGRSAGDHPNGAWMLAADAAIATTYIAQGRQVPQRLLSGALDFAVARDGALAADAAVAKTIAAARGPVVDLLRAAWQP